MSLDHELQQHSVDSLHTIAEVREQRDGFECLPRVGGASPEEIP